MRLRKHPGISLVFLSDYGVLGQPWDLAGRIFITTGMLSSTFLTVQSYRQYEGPSFIYNTGWATFMRSEIDPHLNRVMLCFHLMIFVRDIFADAHKTSFVIEPRYRLDRISLLCLFIKHLIEFCTWLVQASLLLPCLIIAQRFRFSKSWIVDGCYCLSWQMLLWIVVEAFAVEVFNHALRSSRCKYPISHFAIGDMP